MNMYFGQPNLFSRLVKVLLLLSLTIVTLFTLATLFITYSFEDVLFNERLKQAHLKLTAGEELPYDLKLVDRTVDMEPDILQRIRYLEIAGAKNEGEFSYEGRHYHYLLTEYGTILYDTTDVTIVGRALEDIFLILAVLLIPVLFLTYGVARYCAKYALKPFSQLCEVFTESEKNAVVNKQYVERIHEVDVKALASKLHDALNKKATILERQLLLNQGIAHELRTPLQVMEHSIELLSYSHEALCDSAPYVRLKRSTHRMTRLCNGLLWLTSDRVCNTQLSVGLCIRGFLEDVADLTSTHHVKVDLVITDELNILIPKEVLELIIFNLLNNVIQHGLMIESEKVWRISVDKGQIIFSNHVAPFASEKVDESNFGIGLILVTRLAERFSLLVNYDVDDSIFVVTFQNSNPS